MCVFIQTEVVELREMHSYSSYHLFTVTHFWGDSLLPIYSLRKEKNRLHSKEGL